MNVVNRKIKEIESKMEYNMFGVMEYKDILLILKSIKEDLGIND